MSSTIRSNRSTIRSTMRSKEYWARRAEERADKHHEELETYLKRIDSIVNGACGRLKKDAETILNKCVARMGMSREETIKLMQEPVDYESLQRMLKTIEHMPEGAEKRKIQNQVEAKAYGYRVSRIEALEIDIKAESVRLAQRLTEATSNSLKHTAINAIKWTEKDLNEMLGGASISFQKVDPTLIDELIHNSWSGKDFSDRIWKNCEILEKNLNTTLKEGLLSGKGTYRIAEELADDMDCGKYAAQRLVRTETTHVYNEVDRKKYNEAGIEEYEYLACLDERTSEICKRLNGKRFKVDDAKPGVNYPPMHPNCRSTTVAVIDNVWGKDKNYISSNISARNNSKGRPSAIYTGYGKLNKRQERLNKVLKNYNDKVIIKKRDVNLKDIASLTAHNQVEYAMFTKGQERMIVRGNEYRVNIDEVEAAQMRAEGWKWSGHSHIHVDKVDLNPSDGDIEILKAFGQGRSCIINAKGIYKFFEVK